MTEFQAINQIDHLNSLLCQVIEDFNGKLELVDEMRHKQHSQAFIVFTFQGIGQFRKKVDCVRRHANMGRSEASDCPKECDNRRGTSGACARDKKSQARKTIEKPEENGWLGTIEHFEIRHFMS